MLIKYIDFLICGFQLSKIKNLCYFLIPLVDRKHYTVELVQSNTWVSRHLWHSTKIYDPKYCVLCHTKKRLEVCDILMTKSLIKASELLSYEFYKTLSCVLNRIISDNKWCTAPLTPKFWWKNAWQKKIPVFAQTFVKKNRVGM